MRYGLRRRRKPDFMAVLAVLVVLGVVLTSALQIWQKNGGSTVRATESAAEMLSEAGRS